MVELEYITTINSATKDFSSLELTIYSKQFSIFTCNQQSELLVVSGLKSRLEAYTQKYIFY